MDMSEHQQLAEDFLLVVGGVDERNRPSIVLAMDNHYFRSITRSVGERFLGVFCNPSTFFGA